MASQATEEVTACAECRLTSTWKDAFRFGMTSAGQYGLLCPVCWDRYAADWSALRIKSIGIMAVIGLIVPSQGLRIFILSIALCYFLMIALTPLHELAHALAGWLMGFRIYRIQIGYYGKRWFQFRIGRCLWEFRRVPLGGFVEGATASLRFIRIRELIFVAAGPLLNLTLIACALLIRTESAWIGWLTLLVVISNTIQLCLTLQLWTSNSSDEDFVTDGILLIQLLTAKSSELERYPLHYYWLECQDLIRRDDYDAASKICLAGIERFPEEPALETLRGLCQLGLNRYEEARDTFRQLQQSPESSAEYEAMLLNNISWANLMSRDASKLPEALDCSQRAYQILPWEPYINGTRGSVLVETGKVEFGIELLQYALNGNEEKSNQAFNAIFLARGFLKQGRDQKAQAMWSLAKKLDPNCPLLNDWGSDHFATDSIANPTSAALPNLN